MALETKLDETSNFRILIYSASTVHLVILLYLVYINIVIKSGYFTGKIEYETVSNITYRNMQKYNCSQAQLKNKLKKLTVVLPDILQV